jgi:hypothetical protein
MGRWSWRHQAMMTDAGGEVHGNDDKRKTSADTAIAARDGGHSNHP